MMSNRYRASARRCSTLPHAHRRSTANSTRRQARNPPVMSNIQGMRGKMSKNCLWHACQALFAGLVLFSIGAAMSTLGFHADGVLDSNNNSTVSRTYIYNDSRATVRFSKLSYAGPIVMGIGGFVIVATCVLTFEARDSAAKVGPAAYTGNRNAGALYGGTYRARARSLDVRSVASQTIAESNSNSATALHIFDKKALMETFRKFSRTIRTNSSKEDQFHRSPSAPNLLAGDDDIQVAPSSARRASIVPKMMRTRAVPPALRQLRQTMSVDCHSPPFLVQQTSVEGVKRGGVGTGGPSLDNNSSCPSMSSISGGRRKSTGRIFSLNKNNYFESSITSADISVSSSGGGGDCSSTTMKTSEEIAHCSRQIPHHHSYGSSSTVHFQPATVELNFVGGCMASPPQNNSETFPVPTHHKHVSIKDPPFHRGLMSHRNEDLTMSLDRSSMLGGESGIYPVKSPRPKLRTELSCRPTLMRQSRVDHSEIISVPDSDDELILEEDSECDV